MDAVRRNDLIDASIPIVVDQQEHTPPDPARLIFALRQLGYTFEQALADILDNSITAGAGSILIRFICDSSRIRSLAIVDDGCGMNARELGEAMRFGSSRDRHRNSLGKFGMGLKLASFSHARSLTVLTHRGGRALGRRWTIDGINAGWACDVLDKNDASSILQQPWGDIDISKSGTVIIWDNLDRFARSETGLRSLLRNLQKKIEIHTGLAFHRFLEDGSINIAMDQQMIGTPQHGIRVPVKPLNPFSYPESGSHEYPKSFKVSLDGAEEFEAEAHIWPPNSELPEYRLGHKAAARQGFYFYRNDRLIQAGGWNGVVQHDTEPHSSLARVKVDLPSELDSQFGLNVQKSAVVVPAGFESAIENACSTDGITFDAFRYRAQMVYRKQDKRGARLRPAVPGKGMPIKIRNLAESIADPEATELKNVDFKWDDLPEDTVFDVDRTGLILRLNKLYRQRLLRELGASVTDLPVFKLLLFLLLKDEFASDRVSALRRTRLTNINTLLRDAILMEKG